MKFLNRIENPSDLQHLSIIELRQLAREIREYLIKTTSETGGHLSSNLGVVELTIALHRVFNSPEDKLIWDVGHQAYVHKLLTGRVKEMKAIRQFGGISGFPKRSESPHDVFDTGHSSTSISAGVGMATARDLNGADYFVLPIIGDGALTGGMAYEALNNGALIRKKFIIILNDNQMSIGENVGGMALYLDRFRTGPLYNEVKTDVEKTLTRIPKVGGNLVKAARNVKNSVKQLVVPGMFFEELGYTYLGPIDGHDIRQLLQAFEQAKQAEGPVILHVSTIKGKGYHPAEVNPSKYHGVKPFDISNGDFHSGGKQVAKTYSQLVGDKLVELAKSDEKIVAITAAMCSGTGLDTFKGCYPERFFDVGIAEQHAVTFSAAMATQGFKPYFVVYSSFLQRAYDQIIHDVAIQNLPVVFCIDRSGLVGEDGETHQGVFDLAFLSHIPNMVVMAPRSENELNKMLDLTLEIDNPVAIRYPKGNAPTETCSDLVLGEPEWIDRSTKNHEVLLISVGHFYDRVEPLRQALVEALDIPVDLVNLRFVAPINEDFIKSIAKTYSRIYVFEESMLQGGVTSILSRRIMSYKSYKGSKKIASVFGFGIDNNFVEHGNVNALHAKLGLTRDQLLDKIIKLEQRN